MAGYVEHSLAGDEEIVYRAHFNWTFSFFPVLWFALGSAPIVLYLVLQQASGVPAAELSSGWRFAWVGFALGSIILLNHVIILWTTEIVVTTYRFVFKRGLVARHTQEVNLRNIEEITLQQSVWGRLFGYGRIVVRGTGTGVIELPNIDNPLTVRKRIEDARARLR